MSVPVAFSSPSVLSEVQASIDRTEYGALTLDPERARATPLGELVERLARGLDRGPLASAAAAVGAAQLENFPDNLFWDFDCFLASIHRAALDADDYAGYLAATAQTTVGLMELYGQRSEIRFRYVHDFIYGFDWARWVRRDPQERSHVTPFGLGFLQQSESRGRDLLRLIAKDDAWYPRIDQGVSRNPFPFPREPSDELSLYRELAASGNIPIRAWEIGESHDWEPDYDALRRDCAEKLGLVS